MREPHRAGGPFQRRAPDDDPDLGEACGINGILLFRNFALVDDACL